MFLKSPRNGQHPERDRNEMPIYMIRDKGQDRLAFHGYTSLADRPKEFTRTLLPARSSNARNYLLIGCLINVC